MTRTLKDSILEDLKDEKGKKDKPTYTASFPDLVDLVDNDGEVKFLTFDGGVYSERELDGTVYIPAKKVSWLLPRLKKVLEEKAKHSDVSDGTVRSDDEVQADSICKYCDKELYPLLASTYFPTYSKMPTQYHYDYLTWVGVSSHIIEKFNYSPILFLVSNTGRGKSPTLKALAYISRRGVYTESFREANIIRWANNYEASLFFDVTNLHRKIDKNDAEDLIYGRAERGVTTSRVLDPKMGAFNDMVDFNMFGVTGATSNRDIDQITSERCFTIHMPLSTKIFPYPDKQESLPIKEKLTAFRMAHFNTPFVDLKKERYGKLEDYFLDYHKMIKTFFPSHEDEFLKFKEIMKEERNERTADSFEARMVLLIESLKDKVEEGSLCLLYEDILSAYNIDKEKKLSGAGASSIFRKMGFIPKRNKAGNKRGLFFDEELIINLKELNGIKDDVSAATTSSECTNGSEESEEIDPDKLPF